MSSLVVTDATKVILRDDNYKQWLFYITNLLMQKKVWQYAKVGWPALAADASAETTLQRQVAIDEVMGIIGTSIDYKHHDVFTGCTEPRHVLDAFREIFAINSAPRIVELRTDYNSLRMNYPNETVNDYIHRGMELRQSLLDVGQMLYTEQDLVMQLFAGLPQPFEHVKQAIKVGAAGGAGGVQYYTIKYLKPLLLSVERELVLSENKDLKGGVAAFIAKPKFGNGDDGDSSYNKKPKDTRICNYCKKKGHIWANCWKRHFDEGGGNGDEPMPRVLAMTAVPCPFNAASY